MTYTFDKTLTDISFSEAVARTRAALSAHGFGVLTEIDVQQTMRTKLGVEMSEYLILGACNPKMAYEALQVEPQVGAMLPCNVIIRTVGPSVITVSAVDPVASMQAIDNANLQQVAAEVQQLLRGVVREI